ncbi:MAG: N-6 DNA methylase [Bacteroidia bacterium]|nr:N-6 DNA methylase [Bacteroidia bacterium]
MINDITNLINNYRQKVKSASKELTKKEAFKDLLNRLYSGVPEIERIIDKITSGSETTVLNIPRKDRLHKGSADTLYNKIIIEFENDLKVSLKHAREQLAGYMLGQFNSGEGYNFTLIASDCITWKVFVPDVSQLDRLESLTEDELKLNEVASASIILSEDNTEDFYYWIDRFLFKEQKQRATLKRIEESFGYQSPVFIESFRELTRHFNEVQKYGEVQVAYEQWRKFLSIAYGSFDASENNFLIHTYLSVFSKMLAYAVVSNNDYIDEDEMKGIINGNIFNKYNIQNFIDNDFYHWIGSDRNFRGLKKVFRLIAQEISSYDFNDVDEDILKGVYQELIDLDTRHSLGEYYTPDWLCERIVQKFEFKASDKLLDPACGSGSFLRAVIHRIKQLHPDISVEELNNNIYGIDIHPLSVQIAKTTMLLALGKDISGAKKPVHLNIILANTLLAPEGVKTLFGGEFTLQIDKEKLLLNTQVFDDVHLFDVALDVCEDLAEQSMHRKKETKQTFENNLHRRYKNGGLNSQLIDSFYKIYESLKLVKEKGRDSIWKFIVLNLYKPYFLNKKFDYVIGNPPWFTYSSIKNEEYQNLLNELAETYNVKPSSANNYPHLEIAAIFLAYCSNYFLKDKGRIAFVLPRSFFSADHHDNTRSGNAKGFRLSQIWDLNDVSPLFRIPSCVMFAEKAESGKSNQASGLEGISFAGKIPSHNCNLSMALPGLTETHKKWYYIRQGKSSAFSIRKTKKQKNVNPYKSMFKQGATIVPRTFYFVRLTQDVPPDWSDRIINIKTSDDIQNDAKAPWKGLKYSGRIESNFIFRTALSKSILPFALYRPQLVVLPITVENKGNIKEIKLHSARELLEDGYRYASRWFQNAENFWNIHRTEKNKKISSENYLNWRNKLTEQNINAPYIVLYNSSAKDANATVVKRQDFDLELIVESVTYVFYTNNLKEANYLTAILNSITPNLMMKDFQARGLFGARHVHKKILDIYFPRFDGDNEIHIQLAELGRKAHEKVSGFLKGISPEQKIEGIHLGKIRLEIKKYLSKEMKEIDELVRQIIG